ncbi:MAG: hypothetical protein ABSC53_15745 [Bacteroidota bacterium]
MFSGPPNRLAGDRRSLDCSRAVGRRDDDAIPVAVISGWFELVSAAGPDRDRRVK